jgi:hypothetical protein
MKMGLGQKSVMGLKHTIIIVESARKWVLSTFKWKHRVRVLWKFQIFGTKMQVVNLVQIGSPI